jgi:drug/metabolite transporter (DMT)-like permease
MSPLAILLIVTSAVLHAGWNFVSKRGNPSLAFFALTAVSGFLLTTPLLLRYGATISQIPLVLWLTILATGVAQLIYFFGLAGAYQRGDISLAYPLARALPVLFVALISLLLGHREDLTTVGLVGMGLITLGCVLLPLKQFGEIRPYHYFDMVYLMAAIAAVGTTAYTLLDDYTLRNLRDLFGQQLPAHEITLLFVPLQTASTALMLGLGTMLIKHERRQFFSLIKDRALLRSSLLTGFVIIAAYGLVLASMAYVTNVSYVAAFRQLSIPIGALLGLTLQQEPRYRPKLIGIAVVSVGLILVGVN